MKPLLFCVDNVFRAVEGALEQHVLGGAGLAVVGHVGAHEMAGGQGGHERQLSGEHGGGDAGGEAARVGARQLVGRALAAVRAEQKATGDSTPP